MRGELIKHNLAERLRAENISFHLELCALSGNPHLAEHARRILLPFFAFVRVRMAVGTSGTWPWTRDLEAHQRITDLIREGEGEIAEQYVKRAMVRFAKTAYANWDHPRAT